MEGMRHVLVHAYEMVDVQTLWKTIQEDLPTIVQPLERFAAERE